MKQPGLDTFRSVTPKTYEVEGRWQKIVGVGWKFPVKTDLVGKIGLSQDEEDIGEAIRIILGTAKGEPVMRPDLAGYHDLVFAPIDTATITLVENGVREADCL